MSSDSFILSVRGLRRVFPTPEGQIAALDGVSLDVRAGECLSIAGPSGSGKTTLFNLIGGLDAPTEGEVFLQGARWSDMRPRERADLRCRKIGFIFQTFHLCDTMTALENTMLPMIFAGRSASEARARAVALLENVGLADRAQHRPGQLSGGQQQRVAIARAIANDPVVLLADEPTGNLDLAAGEAVIALLADLREKTGVTVLAATHDPAILAISDRVIHLHQGRLVQTQAQTPVGA